MNKSIRAIMDILENATKERDIYEAIGYTKACRQHGLINCDQAQVLFSTAKSILKAVRIVNSDAS